MEPPPQNKLDYCKSQALDKGSDNREELELKAAVESIMGKIPKGYFIGLSKEHAWVICCILRHLFENEHMHSRKQFVLDLGSGKGYIDRILSSVYQIGVFCVEAEKDRLKSSTRLQRLLNDDKTASCDTPFNCKRDLPLMKSCQRTLVTENDFMLVWKKSLSYFRQLGSPAIEIVVLALKVCGDMLYNVVDWVLANWELIKVTAPTECRNLRVIIVPCCLHKSTRLRFPSAVTGSAHQLRLQQRELLGWVRKQLADTSRTPPTAFVEAINCPAPSSYFGIEMNLPFPTEMEERACLR